MLSPGCNKTGGWLVTAMRCTLYQFLIFSITRTWFCFSENLLLFKMSLFLAFRNQRPRAIVTIYEGRVLVGSPASYRV